MLLAKLKIQIIFYVHLTPFYLRIVVNLVISGKLAKFSFPSTNSIIPNSLELVFGDLRCPPPLPLPSPVIPTSAEVKCSWNIYPIKVVEWQFNCKLKSFQQRERGISNPIFRRLWYAYQLACACPHEQNM